MQGIEGNTGQGQARLGGESLGFPEQLSGLDFQRLCEPHNRIGSGQASAALPLCDPALIPAQAHTAMAQALLGELEQSQFPVLEQRLSLTPLRKLWISWRSRRQLNRRRA